MIDVKPGDRIELVAMNDDPDPIPAGTRGTVQHVNQLSGWSQFDVQWDNGRTLMLVTPEDRFRLIRNPIS